MYEQVLTSDMIYPAQVSDFKEVLAVMAVVIRHYNGASEVNPNDLKS